MIGPFVERTGPEVPGLGPVEQLVLRGDGLTTTSLEILTGVEVTTRVRAHWVLPLHDQARSVTGRCTVDAAEEYTGARPPESGRWAAIGFDLLLARPGEELLVRELDLVGDGKVLAAATVAAVIGVLPPGLAHVLGTTDEPIGRLLTRQDVPVRRDLIRWGLRPAERPDDGLGVRPDDRVPTRSYLMRSVRAGRALAVIEEWFAPGVFPTAERTALPRFRRVGRGQRRSA